MPEKPSVPLVSNLPCNKDVMKAVHHNSRPTGIHLAKVSPNGRRDMMEANPRENHAPMDR